MISNSSVSTGINKVTRTISITSGKGGVGKSTVTASLAYRLAKQGYKVLVLDGDFGMANMDIMFGVRANNTIEDLILGKGSVEDVILPVCENLDLIAGGSGVYSLSRMSLFQKRFMMDEIRTLEGVYDYMLIDTAPGIDDDVLYLNSAANEITIILTPDPSSLIDAYALIKVLNQRYREANFSLLPNLVRDRKEALLLFRAISDLAAEQLNINLNYLGFVPLDTKLKTSVRRQNLVSQLETRSPSSFAINDLVKKFTKSPSNIKSQGGLQFFWGQMINVA